MAGQSTDQTEQTAFEFASSAAARVTATGSAAAAMAAAKFKMLRSNTLVVAFGGGHAAGSDNGPVGDRSTGLSTGAGSAGGNDSGKAGGNRDLMALIRARDDRVVNALSTPANRSNL